MRDYMAKRLNQKGTVPPEIRIGAISSIGILKIQFTQPILFPDNLLDKLNKEQTKKN